MAPPNEALSFRLSQRSDVAIARTGKGALFVRAGTTFADLFAR